MKYLIWLTFAFMSVSAAATSPLDFYRIESLVTLEGGYRLKFSLVFEVSKKRMHQTDAQCADRDNNAVPCSLTYASIDEDFTISLMFHPNQQTKLKSLKINMVKRMLTLGYDHREVPVFYDDLPTKGDSFTITAKLSESEIKAATAVPGPEIHRWIFEYQQTMMLIEVTEIDGSPVLTQFAKHQPPIQFGEGRLRERNLDTRAVQRFSVIAPTAGIKRPGFRLEFNPRRTLINHKRTLDSKLMAPISILLYPRETSMVIEGRFANNQITTLRWHGSYWKRPLTEATFTAKIPNARMVLEPGTIHPVSYDDYFLPKHIQMPGSFPRAWPTQTWAELISGEPWKRHNTPELTNVRASKDLILGGRMVGREEAVFKMLNQIDKPTIAEFLALIGEVPKEGETNPFAFYANPRLKAMLEASIPRFIALLERAFPNADLYGLGRDIYLLNDTLDAYFTSRGQPKRVTRLPASAPSFYDSTPETVLEFLKTFGYDLPKLGDHPKIIFDVTSYSNSPARLSQSRQLMRAIYTHIDKLGLKQKDFLRHLNFVSTGAMSGNVIPVNTALDIEKYFNEVEVDSDGPKTILQILNDRNLQYTNAWHDIYGRFQKDAAGRMIAPPGRASSLFTKLSLLSELWVITQTVMPESFHQLVLQQALPTCPETLSAWP